MNILDMMNKLTALSQPVTEAKKPSEGNAFDLKAKVTPEKEKAKSFVHKGKYGMEYQGDPDDEKLDDNGKKKKKAPAAADEKRGRGRPKKGADNAGNVAKPDWSGFGAKKDVKLPKYDKSKTTKHSLKDWIEHYETALNEESQYTSSPLPGATAIKDANGNQVATAATPQAAAMMTKGDVTITDPTKQLKEVGRNHMGETEYHGYYKWRVACRKAGAVEFVGDKDIDEGHDINGKAVGEWDGVVGSVYGDAHKANPAQDPYDQDDPAPMEEGAGGYMINGKEVDLNSIQMGGVHGWDYPDLTDAYVESAEFTDGTPLNDDELDELTNDGDLMNQKAHDSLHEGKKAKPDFLDKDKDGNKKEPFKKAVKDAKKVEEAKKAKPDFLDKDKDGDKKEPFKKAEKDAKKPVDSKYDSRAGRRNGKDDAKAKQVEEGKDEGKPGKNFAKIAKSAGKEYGSKAAGERVAGAVRNKLAKQGKLEEGKVKELDMDLKDPTMKDTEFKKKYGKTKADMKQSLKPEAKKPASKIKESILRESHETMKHIISKFKHEVKNFVAGADMDEDLYDALYDYYCDMGEMPYGTMKARDGDPYEWVTQRFDTDVQDHDVPVDEGKYSQDYFTANKPSPVRQAAAMPAKPVQTPWSKDPIAAVTDRVVDKFTAPKFGDVQFESWSKELDTLLNEGINVTANTGLGDGPDSVTISATDEDAQKLLAIVKSAGLGMFGGDEQVGDEGSPQMSIQGQENPEADINVVDDHDDMLSLIRKMTGQGNAGGQPGTAEVEVDEEQGTNPIAQPGAEAAQAQEYQDEEEVAETEGSSEEEVQQATDKLEKVHNAWSEGEPKGGEDLSHEDTKDMSQDEVDHALDKDLEGDEESDEDEEKEEVDEAYANDADDTFESDIDFMQNVISGGLNKKKQTGQTTIPVVATQLNRLGSPMKESTDLLQDWKKLSGL